MGSPACRLGLKSVLLLDRLLQHHGLKMLGFLVRLEAAGVMILFVNEKLARIFRVDMRGIGDYPGFRARFDAQLLQDFAHLRLVTRFGDPGDREHVSHSYLLFSGSAGYGV